MRLSKINDLKIIVRIMILMYLVVWVEGLGFDVDMRVCVWELVFWVFIFSFFVMLFIFFWVIGLRFFKLILLVL